MFVRFVAPTVLASLAILTCCAVSEAEEQDWLFDRSEYTNDKSGKRVEQYKAKPKVYRIPTEKFYSLDGPHPFGPFAGEFAPWQDYFMPGGALGFGEFGEYGGYGGGMGYGGYGGGYWGGGGWGNWGYGYYDRPGFSGYAF